jgi:hypothetical protein
MDLLLYLWSRAVPDLKFVISKRAICTVVLQRARPGLRKPLEKMQLSGVGGKQPHLETQVLSEVRTKEDVALMRHHQESPWVIDLKVSENGSAVLFVELTVEE